MLSTVGAGGTEMLCLQIVGAGLFLAWLGESFSSRPRGYWSTRMLWYTSGFLFGFCFS